MWELYDSLIEGMTEDDRIEDFVIGPFWTAVLSAGGSVGIAPVISENIVRFDFSFEPERGMSLRDAASHLRSWNFYEASLALASMNAYYNDRERLAGSWGEDGIEELSGGRRRNRAFKIFCEENDKSHILMSEPIYDREEIMDMPGMIDVMRTRPGFRDYLSAAWDELIPQADKLVLSGRAIMEKTAEKMIRLAESNSLQIAHWGVDVPLAAPLKEFGNAELWGFVVDKPGELMNMARRVMQRDEILKTGHFVIIR